MTIKEKVIKAVNICGTHVNLTDPIVSEIFSNLKYDFICVDMKQVVW